MSEKRYAELQSHRNTHIGRYLIELNRSFIAASLTYLARSGFESVTSHHIHIIAQIDVMGTDVSEVLARSGVTKQSLSNTLRVLESNRFVQRVANTEDGRGRRVEFTDRGLALLRAGLEAVEEVECQYTEMLGSERFGELKALLGDLYYAVKQE